MRYVLVVGSLFALATVGFVFLQSVTTNPDAYWIPYVMSCGAATLFSIAYTFERIWPTAVYDAEYLGEWKCGTAHRSVRGRTRLAVHQAAHRNARECGLRRPLKITITETLTLRKEHEDDSEALRWIHSVWDKLTRK